MQNNRLRTSDIDHSSNRKWGRFWVSAGVWAATAIGLFGGEVLVSRYGSIIGMGVGVAVLAGLLGYGVHRLVVGHRADRP